MSDKPVYRGREYYYQDDHMNSKIQQLKTNSSHESYQYTENQPSQGQLQLDSNFSHPNQPNHPSKEEYDRWAGI
uniref:Uncharacterized protein n=1 Tax=viral metagenome TaxID=1070528 RepID=A0A6C0EPQ4_9ZZZZ